MHGDKIDIYDFGVILLEIVSGRPITSYYEVQIMRSQVNSQVDFTTLNAVSISRFLHNVYVSPKTRVKD